MKYENCTMRCQPEIGRMVDSRWWNTAMDFFLPPRCVLCGSSATRSCLCEACKLDLPWIASQCLQCGLPLNTSKDEICGQCIMKTPPFTHTLAALKYQFPADRLVQSFKFNRQLVAGRILSRIMSERAIRTGIDLPGAIIPVPLHRRRLVQRGFNQAYELAADISKHLNLPLLAMALRRRRNTKAQSGLNRKQRRKNLSNAFYWAGATKPCRHIALVDDVMTTGTTVAECTRVLKTAGAKRVDVWVAARATRARKR